MPRDDFPQSVKRTVAARAGFACSNPHCRRSTTGPHSDPSKYVSIGVAVHITAASPGGPRYDAQLASEERRSIDNALWLCPTCAGLVDYDSEKYPADVLREWKRQAEEVAVSALSVFQDANWPREIKETCRRLLQACDDAESTNTKGQALEDLIEVLFTSDDGLVLSDKRVNTADEEIDLVCVNNVNRPFWLALQSPLLFVECKNWTKNVGTKEIRDFEIKIQNHGSLAKLGFFVSLNGFTDEVPNELKRMCRSGYHVVLFTCAEIEEYLESDVSLLNWLEKQISKLK
jgi:hypothetical protein